MSREERLRKQKEAAAEAQKVGTPITTEVLSGDDEIKKAEDEYARAKQHLENLRKEQALKLEREKLNLLVGEQTKIISELEKEIKEKTNRNEEIDKDIIELNHKLAAEQLFSEESQEVREQINSDEAHNIDPELVKDIEDNIKGIEAIKEKLLNYEKEKTDNINSINDSNTKIKDAEEQIEGIKRASSAKAKIEAGMEEKQTAASQIPQEPARKQTKTTEPLSNPAGSISPETHRVIQELLKNSKFNPGTDISPDTSVEPEPQPDTSVEPEKDENIPAEKNTKYFLTMFKKSEIKSIVSRQYKVGKLKQSKVFKKETDQSMIRKIVRTAQIKLIDPWKRLFKPDKSREKITKENIAGKIVRKFGDFGVYIPAIATPLAVTVSSFAFGSIVAGIALPASFIALGGAGLIAKHVTDKNIHFENNINKIANEARTFGASEFDKSKLVTAQKENKDIKGVHIIAKNYDRPGAAPREDEVESAMDIFKDRYPEYLALLDEADKDHDKDELIDDILKIVASEKEFTDLTLDKNGTDPVKKLQELRELDQKYLAKVLALYDAQQKNKYDQLTIKVFEEETRKKLIEAGIEFTADELGNINQTLNFGAPDTYTGNEISHLEKLSKISAGETYQPSDEQISSHGKELEEDIVIPNEKHDELIDDDIILLNKDPEELTEEEEKRRYLILQELANYGYNIEPFGIYDERDKGRGAK